MTTNPFDEKAATWDDDPAKRERARTVAEAVRKAVALEPGTSLLEYGAGTGLVSQELRPHVGAITLADSSRGMLEVLRAKAAGGPLAGAAVWDLDLGRDVVPDARFDLVLSVLTLHHIRDLPPVLRGLAAMLERGGQLCVVDLEREDGSFHDDEAFDGHDGFDRDSLARLLEGAGLRDVGFTSAGSLERHGRDYGMFLATAVRA